MGDLPTLTKTTLEDSNLPISKSKSPKVAHKIAHKLKERKAPYIHRVNDTFYIRIRVPKDLESIFKTTEIKKSLKTSDWKLACSFGRLLLGRIENIFITARMGIMTDEQIRKLIDDFKNNKHREAEEQRALGMGVPDKHDMEDPDVEEPFCYGDRYMDHYEDRDRCNEALILNELEYIEPVVQELLESRGLQLDKQSLEYKKLCREMMKAWINFCDTEMERIEGVYKEPAPTMSQASDLTLTHREGASSRRTQQHKEKTLSELIDLYSQEKTRKKEWTVKTEGEMLTIYKRLLDILGNINLQDIDDTTANKYVTTLAGLPSNGKVKKYKGKTVFQMVEIARRDGDKTLHPKTMNKNIEAVSSLMKWAADPKRRYVDVNYFTELTVKEKGATSEKKKPYDKEDLLRLLQHPVYTAGASIDEAHKFFIPLIAVFTGARENELCSLYLSDIREIDHIPCISINNEFEDKHVKNEKGTIRVIPLHPVLIQAGLLKYAALMRKQGEVRLWPKLTYNKKHGYSNSFVKWFGRENRKYITKDKQKTFHSFRHAWTNNLMIHHVPEELRMAIEGHSTSKQSMIQNVYKGKFPIKQLYEEGILKLDYGISFEGIKFPLIG